MIELMTKQFAKWAVKQKVPATELAAAISEIQQGRFEANLGGHLYKKRIRFAGQGKSGSGRTIICYKRDDRALFIHGFAKKRKRQLIQKGTSCPQRIDVVFRNLSP